MSVSRRTCCWLVVTTLSGLVWSVPPVRGQSNSVMTADPGADITVIVSVVTNVDIFGDQQGVDQANPTVTGDAVVTLFPTDPPFTDCRMQSLQIDVAPFDLVYRFVLGFVQVDVSFSNLRIESAEPFDGVIDAAGNLFVPSALIHISGSARIVSQALTVDETIAVDADSTASITGLLGGGGGIVLMGGVSLPVVNWDVPPDLLPSSVHSLQVTVTTDTSRVIFRGPYTTTPFGDSNADNVIDVTDWRDLVQCMTDSATNPICEVFFADQDGDVDLRDAADFLLELSSP